jgi:hypothetical protein
VVAAVVVVVAVVVQLLLSVFIVLLAIVVLLKSESEILCVFSLLIAGFASARMKNYAQNLGIRQPQDFHAIKIGLSVKISLSNVKHMKKHFRNDRSPSLFGMEISYVQLSWTFWSFSSLKRQNKSFNVVFNSRQKHTSHERLLVVRVILPCLYSPRIMPKT